MNISDTSNSIKSIYVGMSNIMSNSVRTKIKDETPLKEYLLNYRYGAINVSHGVGVTHTIASYCCKNKDLVVVNSEMEYHKFISTLYATKVEEYKFPKVIWNVDMIQTIKDETYEKIFFDNVDDFMFFFDAIIGFEKPIVDKDCKLFDFKSGIKKVNLVERDIRV